MSDDPQPQSTTPQGTQPSHRGIIGRIERTVLGGSSAVDRTQARLWWGGFPYAVFKKYSDDGGSRLAALLTYYGFLSIFPLALVFVAALTLALQNRPDLRDQLLEQLFGANYSQGIVDSYEHLPTGGWALLIGLVGLLLAGMGGVFALYIALNQVWAVPWRQRYGFGPRYLRVTLMLVVLGLGALAVAAAGVVAGTVSSIPALGRVGLAVAVAAVVTLLLVVATKALTARRVSFAEYGLGCLLGGVVVAVVFSIGPPLLGRLIANATPVYGVFATVIGLLTLFYVTAQSVIVTMEISVVRAWRLWPRGIDVQLLFPADRRAYQLLAHMDERMPSQQNTARFDRAGNEDPARDDTPLRKPEDDAPRSPYDSLTTE